METYISYNGSTRSITYFTGMLISIFITLIYTGCQSVLDDPKQIIQKTGFSRGICVLLEDKDCQLAIELAQKSELLIYVQMTKAEETEAAREAANIAGLYGSRVFVETGELTRIHLADNLVDILITADKETRITEAEALRVLRPNGKAFIGKKELTKQFPEGIDEWSHPYHGPDNNPQSNDQIAHAPYLTQFLAEPFYAPFPQVAVASEGRVFKAYGNFAFHEREESLLNTLVAYNGYNGTMLWKRKLAQGYMIHRNTIIATPRILYVGDDKSCKVIDAASGKLIDEIIPPQDVAGGTFWKWMAMENEVLYALIGEQEQKGPIVKQKREKHGWGWQTLSKGFTQPENPWGYGRNLLAINPKTKKVLWKHLETEEIDSRALCMKNGRIYIYRYGTYLACIDAITGKDIWEKTPSSSPELFKAIGEEMNQQGHLSNIRTTAYLKVSDKALYFAGPTVGKLLAVSAKDGSVLWEDPYDNFQIVLHDDRVYGISGESDNKKSKIFNALSGKIVAEIETRRHACARPTGAIDGIFYRAWAGTVRLDMDNMTPDSISPMRPQCHDGVTIANGLLYWWPSVCDCPNILYGITSLGPSGDFDFNQKATEQDRLEQYDPLIIEKLEETPLDWPTFRANNFCDVTTEAVISDKISRLWWIVPETPFTPTASVTVGSLLFLSGSDGIVRAFDSATGELKWKAYTGGPVRFPPTFWKGRLLVGSSDGWVYAFEALTGRLLWKFNAAPENRKIPVYGSLMSTWPVASGVIIEKGIAYFAAGIVNYDGTFVYALNAATGTIKWQNNTSGRLDSEIHTGVSVQGHMLINDGKLFLAGGTTVSPAIFDLEDGKCLNDLVDSCNCILNSIRPDLLSNRGMELYKIGNHIVAGGQPMYGDPEYPVFLKDMQKILHTSANNKDVILINDQKIMAFNNINKKVLNNEAPGAFWGEFNIADKTLWEYDCKESVTMVRCKNTIIFSPIHSKGRPLNFVMALDINTGKELWSQKLVSPPIPWGLIVDRDGRIIITLEDGQIICFGQSERNDEIL